jgi:hypothetical protein
MVGLELLVDPYPTQHHQLSSAQRGFFKKGQHNSSLAQERNHETFCQSATTTLQPKKGLNKEKQLLVRGRKEGSALEALLFQFCAHFIGKRCQWF